MPAVAAPALPQYAPIARAGKMFMSQSFDSGLVLAMNPQPDHNNGGRLQLSFMSQTLSDRAGASPQALTGSLWASGLVAGSPKDKPSIGASDLTAAVADVAKGIAQLGRDVPAATFETVAGVNELLASMQPKDVLVQAWSGGALTTRVVSGDADLGPVEQTIGRIFF